MQCNFECAQCLRVSGAMVRWCQSNKIICSVTRLISGYVAVTQSFFNGGSYSSTRSFIRSLKVLVAGGHCCHRGVRVLKKIVDLKASPLSGSARHLSPTD